jgi:hypothetical protein
MLGQTVSSADGVSNVIRFERSNDSNSLFPGRRRIGSLGVEITRNYSSGQVK